jgi:hypothetical protein
MLLFATNVLWKTTNEGQHWEIISPDLTRTQPEVPESIGDFRTENLKTMPQRGVIYAVSGSPLNKDIIWAGTDDGLVHLTNDGGKTWKDVTPTALTSWDKISQIDAGHFDANTAYISVNAIRKDDQRPHIFKTHDGGTTWKEIVSGMNPSGPVNAVREDPKQMGLLFAGTERELYFTIDDGENWQSLRLNMPATSIRDLVVQENDVVMGTHGRSIWILDDISPLRGMPNALKSAPAHLFKPALATRVRFNMFHDTPLPPEEPTGDNPPDGVALDYVLSAACKEVRIEIRDAQGKIIQSFSSSDKPTTLDSGQVQHPMYWVRPQQKVGTTQGHHRIIWDLRYREPEGTAKGLSIAAVYKNTPIGPHGPFVHPGNYTVRLTVDGKILEQSIQVRLDPRTAISEDDLRLQTDLSMQCYNRYNALQSIRKEMDAKLNNPKAKWKKGQQEKFKTLRGHGDPDGGDILYGSISETSVERESIVSLQDKFLFLLTVIQSSETRPTQQTEEAVNKLTNRFSELTAAWNSMK